MPEATTAPADKKVQPEKKPKNKGGRPKLGESPAMQNQRTFFEKLREIATADWGPRANIHLYRLEPYTDRLRSGNVVYVMKYSEPIDEERILADHGSGKYRAMLTFRKPSAEQGDEVDRIEFELLNTKFPPRVPKGEWVDDPRNKKWAWARNFFEQDQGQPQPSQGSTMVESMRVVNEINTAAEKRNNFAETVKAVKELLPAPPAPQAENALLAGVVALLTKQMEGNGILLAGVLTSAQNEAKNLRDEMRQMREGPASKTSPLDTLKAGLTVIKENMPVIERFLPGLKDGVAGLTGGRSKMGGWQEFLVQFGQPIISDIINSPVTNALGQLIIMKAAQSAQQPANGTGIQPMAAQQVNGAAALHAPRGPANLVEFFNLVWPSMLRYLKEGWTGDEFAAWLWDGFGSPYNNVDWLGQSKIAGAINLVNAFKSSPFWSQIAVLPNGELVFGNFVTAFVAWNPPTEADEAEDEGEIVDLTAEQPREF